MSLKEIKNRLASVSTTRKTTSAMKMVSSVKLRKAQAGVQSTLPYVEQLDHIMSGLSTMPEVQSSPLLARRDGGGRVAIVCFSSDSSLCGGFNSNIIKQTAALIESFAGQNPLVYTVGQKITQSFEKAGIEIDKTYADMMAERRYSRSVQLADALMDKFISGEIDRVVLSYTHFISTGSQRIVAETLLPVTIPEQPEGAVASDFILEPSAQELMQTLLPKVIRMKLHSAMLDSFASEQAARVVAMQAATENADKLIDELKLQYNKLRQQAITNELLDLAGGQQN